jgi:hypothetical protein
MRDMSAAAAGMPGKPRSFTGRVAIAALSGATLLIHFLLDGG